MARRERSAGTEVVGGYREGGLDEDAQRPPARPNRIAWLSSD